MRENLISLQDILSQDTASIKRIYVEKRPEMRDEEKSLLNKAGEIYGLSGLKNIRILKRYDCQYISGRDFAEAIKKVFTDPAQDLYYFNLQDDHRSADYILPVRALDGQFDQRADSCRQCLQMLNGESRTLVKYANIYLFYGKLNDGDKKKLDSMLINPVEACKAELAPYSSLENTDRNLNDVEILDEFLDLKDDDLDNFLGQHGLAMDADDLKMVRDYFKEENRKPTITEIKILDTYWSDHCRHTTFSTILDEARFEDPMIEKTYKDYLNTREDLGIKKPICLMDLATIAGKSLKKQGVLEGLDESEEINACTVKIKINVDGEDEDWLLLFKNETHNHPTEIEPFGGAATCIGGAIRDPLSGRAYVYAAMRVSGAADPLKPIDQTLPGKLPQYEIVREACRGYSSYGNQIGLATGMVNEVYHPGYEAKRMEVGAVIGAVPENLVRREEPSPGDLVLLIGGRTGRDGIGGATGSSKSQSEDSVEKSGAEVQKGNAPEERKLQRFFRNEKIVPLIKRCNDFGAGGVSVAVGELADGLIIDLDKVPKKYEGLDGTELAISESQERMALVIEPENLELFDRVAREENLELTPLAQVTQEKRLVMTWRGKKIVDLSRAFLNSNGAEKHIKIESTKKLPDYKVKLDGKDPAAMPFNEGLVRLVGSLNACSQKGLGEQFDSTIGQGTVLMPYGGKNQRTPIQTMVHKISMEKGDCPDLSFMSWSYDPYLSSSSPYHGAYMAVLDSLTKLVASGAGLDRAYLSLQEYFPAPGRDPGRWALPTEALLGAYRAQLDYSVAAIGGKDSMSGTYEDLDVPPTLISFSVAMGRIDRVLSPEFKGPDHRVMAFLPELREDGLPNPSSVKKIYRDILAAMDSGKIKACRSISDGGIMKAIFEMAIGNDIGFNFNEEISSDPRGLEKLYSKYYGGIIAELADNTDEIRGNSGESRVRGYMSIQLGQTLKEKILAFGKERSNLSDLIKVYENKLESVYPLKADHPECQARLMEKYRSKFSSEVVGNSNKSFNFNILKTADKIKVLIPVFPGTNTEYDSKRYVESAGLDAKILVIRNTQPDDIKMSLDNFSREIEDSQILYIPGGFSGGDEPDGSAKFINSFMRNPQCSEAITDLIDRRGGLVLGICNGFQALIKLGLLPYGKIVEGNSSMPALAKNIIGKHMSGLVNIRYASKASPWLRNVDLDAVYRVPISHGEGRIAMTKSMFEDLAEKGQIAGQYVDLEGNPSMDIEYNPNGSYGAIEGLLSPDGRILGKMGHSERVAEGLYKNVPGLYDIKLFESAKKSLLDE